MGVITDVLTAAMEQDVARHLRLGVLAAMETGNIDRARMLIVEVEDRFPHLVPSVKADVRESYGIVI